MLKKYVKKITLGTAQLFSSYGIANTETVHSISNSTSLLSEALELGIDSLDTAPSYPQSEETIGLFINRDQFKIITKVTELTENGILSSVEKSLKNLHLNKLYAILVHDVRKINASNIDNIFSTFQKLKDLNIIEKIGVSIYRPDDLDIFLDRTPIDIVQAPFNIFDKRIINSGYATELSSRNIELHIRSVFLQGLLLMPIEKIPYQMLKINNSLLNFHEYIKKNNINPYDLCLSHALRESLISKIVLGIDTASQLQMLKKFKACSCIHESFTDTNLRLIDPRLWK